MQTPTGKLIHYYYDGYGRQTKRITPDAGQTDFIYDKNSNLIYSQDENQKAASTSNPKFTFRNYDGLNRLTGTGEATFLPADDPFDGIQYVPSSSNAYLTINVYDTLSSAIVPNFFTLPSDYPTNSFKKGNLISTAYRTRYNDFWSFKYFLYDVRGRVIRMWNDINGLGTLVTEYSYNSQDQVINIIYKGKLQGDSKSYQYNYDFAGRLGEVKYSYIPSEEAPTPIYYNFTDYTYNANSLVDIQGYRDSEILNTYFYNNRNWISYMHNPKGGFEYTNDYFKNGNVKSQSLAGSYKDNFARSDELTFNYTYDNSNRLETTTLAGVVKLDYKMINTYDLDGNILSLKRHGSNNNLLDDFAYTYYSGSNRLQRVMGAGNQFGYDNNGNLIQDYLNNNSEMNYDNRNLLTELKHRSQIIGDTLFLTKYFYDEAGNRIRKMTYKYLGSMEDEPAIDSDVSNTALWILKNDEVYSRGADGKELAIYKNGTFDEWIVWGNDMVGKMDENHLYFYQKDHLGSIRAILNENQEIDSSQDYDPWGYLLEGRTYQSDESKFKFTGKERDAESFYDYFGARYYDSRIANWTSVDPLMEKHYDYSPYNYVLRNPMRLIDPDGQQVDFIKTFSNVYNYYSQIKIEHDYYNSLSLVGKQQDYLEYVKSMGSSGRIEPTGDEMLLAGALTSSFSMGSKLLKIERTLETQTALAKTTFTLSKEASKRMTERGITKTMIEKSLEKGAIYSGHESGALTFILKDAFASGKSLLVGQNPLTKNVTTVIRGPFKDLNKAYLKPLSEETSKITRGF